MQEHRVSSFGRDSLRRSPNIGLIKGSSSSGFEGLSIKNIYSARGEVRVFTLKILRVPGKCNYLMTTRKRLFHAKRPTFPVAPDTKIFIVFALY